jgi:hypothetical protein
LTIGLFIRPEKAPSQRFTKICLILSKILTGFLRQPFSGVPCQAPADGAGITKPPGMLGILPQDRLLGGAFAILGTALLLAYCIFGRQQVQAWRGTPKKKNRIAMKTSSKSLSAAALMILISLPAYAQNNSLTCWYNANADFTSSTPGDSGKKVGSVQRSGSGDKTYSYVISARDATACPVQLPLSTDTALTVALVRQESESCSNENVSDAGQASLGGSVTIIPTTYNSLTASVKLAGVSPNTTYRVFIKCGKQLGALRTDAEGNGGRTFNYLTDALSPAYAFEIAADGAEVGGKLQSLTLKK